MFNIVDYLHGVVPGYMLVFARITAMLLTMPIFSYPMISQRIRTLLSFALALVVATGMDKDSFPQMQNFWEIAEMLSVEIFVGLLIGFGARMIFEGFAIAGGLVGLQMGVAMANVMDPTSRQQVPIVSQFWMLVMILFLLSMDGHLFLVETIFRNFQMIPLGIHDISSEVGDTLLRGGSKIFSMGIQFAAPTMAFLLLLDTGIGFMARVMPQMNIFFISMPIKIGVGMVMLIVSLDIFQLLFNLVYTEMIEITSEIIMKIS